MSAMEISKQIFENLTSAVLVFDHKLKLTAVNPSAEMLFATSAKKMLGHTLDHWLSKTETSLKETLTKVSESQHPVTMREATLQLHGKRTITVDYTITPIIDDNIEAALIMEMVQVDRILRLAQEEKMQHLHATNKAVIRGVAHEIKNPLGGIRGAAQLLARELPNPELEEYTSIIIEEADRLRALIDRMFGPNQVLNLKMINIHEVLEHIRRLILAEVQEGLDIITSYDPSLPEIPGDRDQLIQAILNVVRNAVQAMDNKGVLELRSRIERQFTIGQNLHRLAIRLDIIDNGPGIPADLVQDIFYPLVTGRPEGTGLGLSISQDIIARHGGLIQCTSEPGNTVFSIYLPLENSEVQS
ncbi:MAG: nitrogen regulation protein NR(II) [Gammaproteobacteria bacterium]|nr:nitrogen regulation protein NR(II) [Gammaproteobacteria bacterium]